MKNISCVFYTVEFYYDSHRAYKLLIRIIYNWPVLNVFENAVLFQFSKLLYHKKKSQFPAGTLSVGSAGNKQLTLKISTLQLSLLLSARNSA